MICLGIESTAHTFSVAIVNDKGDVLAHVKEMYITKHGGIIPKEAALHHKNVKDLVLKKALNEAKLNLDDINILAFSKGPGLAPSLLVGMNLTKELAKQLNLPVVGVNHIAAHLSIGRLFSNAIDPVYIFVSGANTQIIIIQDNKYKILGEALSISLGNALDKFGRFIDLGFPAGPKVEELAKNGKYIKLPYVVKGMDVEFSGIVTAAQNKFSKGIKREDLCFSLQETCFAMLTEVAERALAFTEKNEALLVGGVATNKRLCNMLDTMCKDRGAKFYVAPLEYCMDNGAMIAWQGILDYKDKKKLGFNDIDIKPRWRLDEL